MRSLLVLLLVTLGVCAQQRDSRSSFDIETAYHFGDSISFGGGSSSPSTEGWVPDLARLRGWGFINFALGSEYAADQAVFVMGHNVPDDGAASFYALGRNDAAAYWDDARKMADFSTFTLANLAWLALPDSAKATGENGLVSYYGTGWKSSPYWTHSETGGTRALGKLSCQVDDNASAIIFNSTAIYVDLTMIGGGVGRAQIVVDGVSYGRFDAFPSSPDSLTTYNGRAGGAGPQVIRITGFDTRQPAHLVEVIISGGCAAVHWIGGNGSAKRPAVYAVGIAKTGTDDLNSRIAIYDGLIRRQVATLASDGN